MEQYISKEFPDGASVEAALLRAKAGGAIDLALSTKPGQDLLDNSCFLPGFLVDQRQGYVVKPGMTYYTTDWVEAGLTDKYYPVKQVNSGSIVFEINGTTYYAGTDAAVRGYTGIVHGPDRWKLLNSQCTVTIDNGGITLHRNGGDIWIFAQTLEPELVSTLTGKFVIISVMTDAGLVEFPVSSAFTAEQSVVSTSGTCIWLSAAGHLFLGTTADSVKLKAAKLDLGDTQTIAHQDKNGNWQLNEIPDYGEQLRRCQRYFYRWPYLVQYLTLAANGGYGMADFQFPVTMRTIPTITNIAGYNTDLSTFNFAAAQGGVHFQNTGTDMVSITNFDAIADL